MDVFVIQCCVVSLTSISYTVRNSAGKGYVTCVENFQISCFSGHVGFWLSRLTFTAGLYLSIFSFALESFWSPLFLTALDIWGSLFLPASQYQQCSGTSYVQIPLHSAVSYISCE